MTTYDVLVTDSLADEFTNDSDRLPEGFRILGPAEGPAAYRSKRFRVEDDNAPPWTEGKLIRPQFRAEFEVNEQGHPTGNVARVVVDDWREEDAEAVRIGAAMQQAEDQPGRRAEA